MSNPYYNFTTELTPGTRGRAGEINDQFLAIQTGFDNIPAVGSAPFGTPTVKVGLAPFVQGVANFVLRSDAKLVLDESIAPTWSDQHSFTDVLAGLTGPARFMSATPGYLFQETDVAVDSRWWRHYAVNGVLKWDVSNDANSITNTWMAVSRTGATIDSIALTSTAFTWNGNTFTTTGANTFTGNQTVSNAAPAYSLYETDAALNEKLWRWIAQGGDLFLETRTDADGAGATPIQITRTATTVDSIALTSAALTWNGNTLFSTANDGASSGLDADLLDGVQGSDYARISVGNTFTANQSVTNAAPEYGLNETDASANNKRWQMWANGEAFRLAAVSDAGVPVDFFVVDRTAQTIDSIALTATTISLTGALSISGQIAASAAEPLRIANNNGFISFYNTAGSTRRGYLQAVTGNVMTLASEEANQHLDLTTAGTGQVRVNGQNVRDTAILNTGTLAGARMPAFTGDVATSAGSLITSIAANAVVTNTINNDAVTYAKMQNISATSRVLGRITSGAGDTEELTGANLSTIIGLAAIATSGSASDLASGTIPSARVTAVDAACTISSLALGYLDVPRITGSWAAGKCRAESTSTTLNTSDMATSRCMSFYNDSGSTITLTQGAGVTLRKHGTATSGSLTVAIRGMVTIWCNSATEAIALGDVS